MKCVLCVVWAVTSSWVFIGAALAQDEPIQYDRPRQLATLGNPDIEESSGLAWSWNNEGVLWTHNDSGDQPRIFAFNMQGTHVAEYRLDAELVDWEDMAVFKTDRDEVMIIADIGDNDLRRKSYTLYTFKEPTIRKQKIGRIDTLRTSKYEFTYEDGPHNCEAIGVDATNQRFILVEKREGAMCNVYEMPLPNRRDKEPLVAKKIATIAIPTVTGMDISVDGLRAIVLTYGDAYEYKRGKEQTWAQAFAARARIIPMPYRRKGESICYGGDGKTLYLTSEGKPTPLWQVPVREE